MKRFALPIITAWIVFTIPVRGEDWTGNGVVIARHSARLHPRTPQLVAEVLHDVGDVVKEGEILVRFDDKQAKNNVLLAMLNFKRKQAELHHAKASIDGNKATLARAQSDLDRSKAIFAKGALDRESLVKYEADYLKAKTDIALAEIHVELATIDADVAKLQLTAVESNLDFLTIRAPFAGIVAGRYCNQGDFISRPDQAIMELIGGSHLVEAELPEKIASKIAIGQPVEVLLDKGAKSLKGRISRIAVTVDPRLQTLKFQVELPDEATKTLRPGTIIMVKLDSK